MFSFAFDNGYHSNGTLEGLDTYYFEIEQAATTTTYGGGFFGLEPEGLVRGWSSSSISGTMKGESFFLVIGRLVAPGRMAGTWEFVETSGFGDCQLNGGGGGEWEAEAG